MYEPLLLLLGPAGFEPKSRLTIAELVSDFGASMAAATDIKWDPATGQYFLTPLAIA